jgi:hypothetical protein
MDHKHLEFLYEALESPLGVVIETNNAEALRQKLYTLRRSDLEQFEHLSFIISPINGTDLWIVKNNATPETHP